MTIYLTQKKRIQRQKAPLIGSVIRKLCNDYQEMIDFKLK